MGNAPFGPATRPSLLLRIRNSRDDEAWKSFVACYAPFIVGYCQRQGLQAAEAQDVAQDVMLQLMRSIGQWDYEPARGGFRGWLFRVTRSKFLRHIQKNKRQVAAAGETEGADLCAHVEDPDWVHEFDGYILQTALERIRPEFDPTEWRAFESTWKERRPGKDVALALGRKVGWVHKAAHRVRKRLEDEVRNLTDDCPFLC